MAPVGVAARSKATLLLSSSAGHTGEPGTTTAPVGAPVDALGVADGSVAPCSRSQPRLVAVSTTSGTAARYLRRAAGRASHREVDSIELVPIGIVHSPFLDKRSAPRQPGAGAAAEGSIELFAGRSFEYALQDVERWSHLWVIFCFDRAEGWRPKVRPPRSREKRGVFATRAPHRPNPIGLSAVRLLGVEGLTLHVADLDILDGSPVLDLKPYVPYADAITQASDGWLRGAADRESDAGPRYDVCFAPLAERQLGWLLAEHGVELGAQATQALSLGVAPHPYRRIKREGDQLLIAVGDWRLVFTVEGSAARVLEVRSGYRRRQLKDPAAECRGSTPLSVHRAFVAEFGRPHDR